MKNWEVWTEGYAETGVHSKAKFWGCRFFDNGTDAKKVFG